jgi:hypothetical protein
MAYSYADLKDVRYPTEEELERATWLYRFLAYNIVLGVTDNVLRELRRAREELEKRSLQL